MKYRVKFTPTATRQFDRLDAWWKENRDKNPFLFADGVTERKFLGFTFTRAWMGIMRLRPAAISVERMKDRIRELTRPTRGRNLEQIAGDLRRYLTGWKAYFGFAESSSKTLFRDLDGWIRRRLRAFSFANGGIRDSCTAS